MYDEDADQEKQAVGDEQGSARGVIPAQAGTPISSFLESMVVTCVRNESIRLGLNVASP